MPQEASHPGGAGTLSAGSRTEQCLLSKLSSSAVGESPVQGPPQAKWVPFPRTTIQAGSLGQGKAVGLARWKGRGKVQVGTGWGITELINGKPVCPAASLILIVILCRSEFIYGQPGSSTKPTPAIASARSPRKKEIGVRDGFNKDGKHGGVPFTSGRTPG